MLDGGAEPTIRAWRALLDVHHENDEHSLQVLDRARFGQESDARVVRGRLACADHDVVRGRYQRAISTLDGVAVSDAGQAGALAASLLGENASTPDVARGEHDTIMERALLGTLLPVFDRVIDLLIGSSIY